jgi:hypothetical protein
VGTSAGYNNHNNTKNNKLYELLYKISPFCIIVIITILLAVIIK